MAAPNVIWNNWTRATVVPYRLVVFLWEATCFFSRVCLCKMMGSKASYQATATSELHCALQQWMWVLFRNWLLVQIMSDFEMQNLLAVLNDFLSKYLPNMPSDPKTLFCWLHKHLHYTAWFICIFSKPPSPVVIFLPIRNRPLWLGYMWKFRFSEISWWACPSLTCHLQFADMGMRNTYIGPFEWRDPCPSALAPVGWN